MAPASGWLVVALPTLLGCGVAEPFREPASSAAETDAVGVSANEAIVVDQEAAAPDACDQPVAVWRDGVQAGEVCPERASSEGLTLIDLSDGWTPRVFSEDGTSRQPYRATYLALADERFGSLPRNQPAERYLELYGIQPTFRVLHARIAEDERHRCHDAVDDAALPLMTGTLRPWAADPVAHAQKLAEYRALRRRLEGVAQRRDVGSIDALRDDSTLAATWTRYDRVRVPIEAGRAAQAHLRCDGLLGVHVADGLVEWHTATGLRIYQQRHMVVSGGFLDAQTRRVLALDSREADFLAVLRTLRERVVDATGIIEDGSAARVYGKVLGRDLDPPELRADGGQSAAPDPASDLVSPATEAAARALGWTDPGAFRRAYEMQRLGVVALPLPAPPPWHAPHMELRAEVDRGDVWYQYPYTDRGGVRAQTVQRRPVLTLYARHDGREIALFRWPTTIGGWKPELGPEGTVRLRYKNSPVGPRVWRDLIASPAWLPPPSAPDSDLMRRRGERWFPNHTLLGPGYRSAYGLAMLIHHGPRERRDPSGPPVFDDEGIRTHGSVSYRSILVGTSHGCHRLYNHLAVRLVGFILAHRTHARRGRLPADYERELSHEGSTGTLSVDTRGYLFELTPPVPVEVLEGNVRGRTRRPSSDFHELREELIERVQTEAAEDG